MRAGTFDYEITDDYLTVYIENLKELDPGSYPPKNTSVVYGITLGLNENDILVGDHCESYENVSVIKGYQYRQYSDSFVQYSFFVNI